MFALNAMCQIWYSHHTKPPKKEIGNHKRPILLLILYIGVAFLMCVLGDLCS